MPKETFYANGTISLKNSDGDMVEFHPKTKTDCVYDYQTNRQLSAEIATMESDIAIAANTGGVKTIYEDEDNVIESYAESQSFESLVAAIEPDYWQITVDTRKLARPGYTSATNKVSAIPFNLYQQSGVTLTVNWGDGTTSTLTRSNYSSNSISSFSASEHTYPSPGIYQIKIYCNDFSKVGLVAPYVSGISTTYTLSTSSTIAKYCLTLISIDNAIPKIKGVYPSTQYVQSSYCRKEWNGAFYECANLQSIPADLFSNNTDFTSFCKCFDGCISLKEVPNTLFKGQTEATDFSRCFNCCYSLTTIPPDLFRWATKASNMQNCFDNAHGTRWNGYTHKIKDFEIYVASSGVNEPFKVVYNTGGSGGSSADRYYLFVPYKHNVQRIVHCPASSTTFNTFTYASEDMNLTAVGD